MTLQPGERRTCPACGVEFVGAKNLVDPRQPGADVVKEGVLPITIEPNPDKGNTLLQQIDGVLRCIVFGDTTTTTWLRERGVQLRVPHFADCVDPSRFRRPPTRPEQGAA